MATTGGRSGILILRLCPVVGLGLLGLILGTGWSALLLAELGRFSAVAALTAGLVSGALLSILGIRSSGGRDIECRDSWGHVVAMCIAAGSLFLTLPPSEMILGGWDPGVYIHTAAAVSRSGSLQIPADDFTRLTEEQLRTVSRDLDGIPEPFGGMRLLPNGKLSPQFFHLYPALMAVAYAFFGVWGCLALNAVLNAGCILGIYALAKMLYGWKWGIAAAVLLALNPAQVWQAKFQTSEMLTQFLLLAGTSALLELDRPERKSIAAILAGSCYGLALLTRYDTILFLAPLLILLLWHASTRRTHRGAYLTMALVLLCGLHAWLHMVLVAPYYHPLTGIVVPGLVVAVVLGLVVTIAALFMPLHVRERVEALAARARPLLAACFLLFIFWAWYVRPRLTIDGRTLQAAAFLLMPLGQDGIMSILADSNAWNMHRLVAVYGQPGMLLACAGIGVMLASLRCTWRARGWLISSVFVMAILVTNAFHDHFMMWVMRRFIPVIVPLLAVGTVAVARACSAQLTRWSRPLGKAGAMAVVVLALVSSLPASRAMATMRNWPGLVEWYKSVDAALPRESIIFCDQPGFAAPLRFLYGHRSYEINVGSSDSRTDLDALIRAALSRSTHVHFLSMRGVPSVPGVRVEIESRHDLSSSILQQPRVRAPKGSKERGGHFVLYRLVKGGQ